MASICTRQYGKMQGESILMEKRIITKLTLQTYSDGEAATIERSFGIELVTSLMHF